MIFGIAGRKVNIPCRTAFTQSIEESYEIMKSKLIAKIGSHEHVCMTADVWSSRAQSYLGCTIHFFTDELKRESYLLGFHQTKQTHDVLANELAAIMKRFRIVKSKITHIVTDGGSIDSL